MSLSFCLPGLFLCLITPGTVGKETLGTDGLRCFAGHLSSVPVLTYINIKTFTNIYITFHNYYNVM